jgi:ribosomal protein S14
MVFNLNETKNVSLNLLSEAKLLAFPRIANETGNRQARLICLTTGRRRAVLKKFYVSRTAFREQANKINFIGVKKA